MNTPENTIEFSDLELESLKQRVAYQIWEDDGRPEGKSEDHWSQACLVVMSMEETDQAEFPVWLQRIVAEEAGLGDATEDSFMEAASESTVQAINRRNASRAAA